MVAREGRPGFGDEHGHSSVGYLGVVAILLGIGAVVTTAVEQQVVRIAGCRVANLLGSTAECHERESETGGGGSDLRELRDSRSTPWIEGRADRHHHGYRPGFVPVANSGVRELTDVQLDQQESLRTQLTSDVVSSMLPVEVTLPLVDMIFYQNDDLRLDLLNRRLLQFRIALVRDYLNQKSLAIYGRELLGHEIPAWADLKGTIGADGARSEVVQMLAKARELQEAYDEHGYFLGDFTAELHAKDYAEIRATRLERRLGSRWREVLELGPPYDRVDESLIEELLDSNDI